MRCIINPKNFVLKCGGSTLTGLPITFFQELKRLQDEGFSPVIVHGGGPAISNTLTKLNIETEFIDGLRVTTNEVLDVVEMVLSGKMNKEIVRKIQMSGAITLGLSGVDGDLLEAEPVHNVNQIGYVGDIKKVNSELILNLIDAGYIPVIAPVGIDKNGQRYNVNADTAAGAVASHLGVRQMIVVTDVPGIMKEENGEKEVLPNITAQEIEEMIHSGEIFGGMIPKVRAAMKCIQGDVQEVLIVNGAEPNVLTKVLKGENIGTRITK
ncbi:acetylglutamate kinase [Chengkuizengella axinellae]|uniref:Acetylglutamate kinase n=1 Tax=Chengkuizengella axinellae TaxID=3064388 RepID=A0ABT9J2R5_9BACL|nr:acetylglutamate kinase [Chengkuizengella sp. 2205SS18-9]MDP5275899.1 acetylglutamate kinase [Chengkuizengella sp. 2205SS18-9]